MQRDDDVVIEVTACIDRETHKQVDCDRKREVDRRTEKEMSIRGRDDREYSSHYSQKKSSNFNNVVKPEIDNLMPKNVASWTKLAASIIAESQGKKIKWSSGFRRKVDPIWGGTIKKVEKGDWEGVLLETHRCLVNPQINESRLNISNLAVEKYLLIQAKAQTKSQLREHYEAVNTVLSSYSDLYEKKFDAKLKQSFKQLSENFRYSSQRVGEAQKRYLEFVEGKRFKVSPSDQKLLDALARKNNVASLQQSAKKLQTVSKVFGGVGKILNISDLATAFNEAQKTKDWRRFYAKISELGSGMLIGSIVGLAVGSIPVVIIAAVVGVVAANYFDEEFWLNTQSKIADYFVK